MLRDQRRLRDPPMLRICRGVGIFRRPIAIDADPDTAIRRHRHRRQIAVAVLHPFGRFQRLDNFSGIDVQNHQRRAGRLHVSGSQHLIFAVGERTIQPANALGHGKLLIIIDIGQFNCLGIALIPAVGLCGAAACAGRTAVAACAEHQRQGQRQDHCHTEFPGSFHSHACFLTFPSQIRSGRRLERPPPSFCGNMRGHCGRQSG